MLELAIFLITYLFVLPTQTNAYLDPGTGSYVTQIVIGFFVGSAYIVKLYWHQLKIRARNLFNRKKNEGAKNDD